MWGRVHNNNVFIQIYKKWKKKILVHLQHVKSQAKKLCPTRITQGILDKKNSTSSNCQFVHVEGNDLSRYIHDHGYNMTRSIKTPMIIMSISIYPSFIIIVVHFCILWLWWIEKLRICYQQKGSISNMLVKMIWKLVDKVGLLR